MKLTTTFALFAALILASSASASSMMVVEMDPHGRDLSPLTFIDKNGVAQDYAGVISASLNGGSALDAFCIDLYHDSYVGQQYHVNVLPVGSAAVNQYSPNVDQAAWLYATYLPVVNASSNKNVEGAALQLAIWDVIYDAGDGLFKGTIKEDQKTKSALSIAAYSYANSWIAASAGHSLVSGEVLMNVSGPNGSQTLLTGAGFVTITSATPEPGTLALFATALIGLGLLGRKRFQLIPATAARDNR